MRMIIIKMNKKGATEEILNFFRLVFLIVVFSMLVYLTHAFVLEKISVFDVESKLLVHRLLFSNDLNYVDGDTGRVYIGIIDLQKITSEDFQNKILNSIYYGKINSEASAKLTLRDTESGIEHEAYYNKELYDEKKVLVEAKLIGAGAAKSLDTNFYVLIKDKDKLKKGVLKIDAILPNS